MDGSSPEDGSDAADGSDARDDVTRGIDDPVVVDAEEVDPEDGGLAHRHDFATAWTDAPTRARPTE